MREHFPTFSPRRGGFWAFQSVTSFCPLVTLTPSLDEIKSIDSVPVCVGYKQPVPGAGACSRSCQRCFHVVLSLCFCSYFYLFSIDIDACKISDVQFLNWSFVLKIELTPMQYQDHLYRYFTSVPHCLYVQWAMNKQIFQDLFLLRSFTSFLSLPLSKSHMNSMLRKLWTCNCSKYLI